MVSSSDAVLMGAEARRTSRLALRLEPATAATALLVVAAWPGAMFPSWSPRFSVLVVVGALGVVLLARLALTRDRAAMLAFVVVATLMASAAVSPDFRSSAVGFVGRDLSVVTATLCFGCWAVGRHVTDRRALTYWFVAAVCLAATIGLIQVVADIGSGFLALQAGRPASLLVNPVYFGAMCAGGTMAAAALLARSTEHWRWIAVATVLAGAGVSLSGSRVAALVVLVASLGMVGNARSRSAVTAVGIVVLGLVAGTIVDLALGSNRGAVSRVSGANGGGRSTVWRYGFDAWLDRPLLGHGIGRFRPATQAYFEEKFVLAWAFDDRKQAWFDPHNIVIMLLVAAGVVGVVVVATWLAFALRTCSGPLLWGSVAIAGTFMLQPVSIHTLPVAMLLLGAAAAPIERAGPVADMGPPDDRGGVRWRIAERMALTLGLFAGVYILLADARLDRAVERLDPAAAATAAAWYWDDPIVDDVVAQVFELNGDLDGSIVWRERAAATEPDRPYWWSQLARARFLVGDLAGGRRALETALELQPTNARARAMQTQLEELEAGG